MKSEAIDLLATALAAAQGELKNAKINRQNPHFKNRYADLASVRDAISPALTKHGIAVTQTMKVSEGAFMLETTLLHKSGQWIASDYPLPLNAKPQELGSALTYARRYSLSSLVNIAADEDDDAEAANKAGNGASTDDQLAKKDGGGLYKLLQTESRAAKNETELKTWMKKDDTQRRIQQLPDDWQDSLRVDCAEALALFRENANV
jgi:hypothetical protein